MSDHIRVYEVGPRDGLQNEKALIPTAAKIGLVDILSTAGFEKIEATSFVSPKWVPQLADARDVMDGISRVPTVDYAVLTPNLKGFEMARAAGADEVAIFASASEGFSQHNINCSISESLERFTPLMDAARDAGIPVRGYVSCVVACPYDGAVAPEAVRDVAHALKQMGCYEISLGDTIGAGTPESVSRMLKTVLERIPAQSLAGHFHDTGDTALGNVEASLDLGLRTFDSAVGGLGGCPYAPGAKGNLSTLTLVERLASLGYDTGIDIDVLRAAERLVSDMTKLTV
ncbi:hydroxymethylglutaryl-CoA lyase [Celeribacter baekdonensis]|uniref:hydroxymethylglutaryl-CoA lyase n=1 Tax=Celeribacter baekdonensis TaxID=875171 RepID=A0A2R4LY10_9RHOB|nr:hydroxymethylglutaryl-CoA lyase [Celeribacter baekdonensis]AVW89768.1 hydroxymethylglutaryl-CoA lyase [Celeribacter baekdonensis]